MRLAAVALLCLSCTASQNGPNQLLGAWTGRAEFRGAALAFTIHFTREGRLGATFSSPDLLMLDQPLDSVRQDDARVRFATPDDHPMLFDGVLAGDSIVGGAPVPAVPGVVTAQGEGLRFVLHRASDPAPLPYVTREVGFAAAPGVRLAGTLFIPNGPGRHPGIVILQGSSSNLRREYAFYADHFARLGLAVLTFDKRGKGASTGDYGAATYQDLTGDAVAAVTTLRAQPEVSPQVGVWGLSQGAFLAPMVAARTRLAFIVAVSPPGVTTGESAAYQDSVRLINAGFPVADAARAAQLNRQIVTWLEQGEGGTALSGQLARSAGAPWRLASSLPAVLPGGGAREGWYWQGRTLDPVPSWRALTTPVLVVFGAADELLPAGPSATRIGQALRQGGNRDATVRSFPAANHILRRLPLVAGGAWDWPRGAPGYLDLVTEWVLRHASPALRARA